MKRISPEVGKTYKNRNGSDYICKAADFENTTMERIKDGWTLIAHGVCQYEDGTIEWDYSTNGHW